MTSRTLYYAPGACSLASHIVLEEIGAPFETVRLDLKSGDQRAPEYLAVNERGRVPALYEDGWVLTESSAVLRHLARSHPEIGLWPDAPLAQGMADEWMSWLATNHHVAYAHVLQPERYSDDEASFAALREKGAETYADLCTMTEVHLSNGGWALGENYSVVDPYLLVFWLWGHGSALSLDMPRRFPAWTAHARALWGRPTTRAAFAREGLGFPN